MKRLPAIALAACLFCPEAGFAEKEVTSAAPKATPRPAAAEATPAAAAPTPAGATPQASPGATPPTSGEVSDASIKARADALEVAGAFANEGFKTRDGHWMSSIRTGEPKVIEVNLYAGNQYWFIAAASQEAKRLAVSIHDEKGKPVAFHPYQDQVRAAAGFSPDISGPYYIRVVEEEGDPAVFALIYSYK